MQPAIWRIVAKSKTSYCEPSWHDWIEPVVERSKNFKQEIMNRISKLLILISMFVPNMIQAQARQHGAVMKVHLVSIQDLSHEKFILVAGKQQQEVEISSSRISQGIKVPVNTPCLLRRVGAEYSVKPPFARFTLKPGQKHQLVVLLPPSEKSSEGCRVTILNIDPNVFRGGERYAINLSSFPVIIKLGMNANTSLAPRKTTKIVEPSGKNGDFLRVAGVFKNAGHWKPFMSSRWIRDGESRSLIFIYANARTKSLAWNGMRVPFPAPESSGGL